MTGEILPSRRIRSDTSGDIVGIPFDSHNAETDTLCAAVQVALKHWDNPIVRDQLDKLLTVVKLVDNEALTKVEESYAGARKSQDFMRVMKTAQEMLDKGLISKTAFLQMLNRNSS